MAVRGAIFDLDGTLVDSAALHEASWRMLAEELGLRIAEDWFHRTFGRANMDIIPELLGHAASASELKRYSDRKEELYRQIARERLRLVPGAGELLADLKRAGWRVGIGSSTPRANLDFAVPLLGLSEWVDAYVGMEDVARHKPEPDTFVETARRLGVAPNRCLVFEDAPAGVEAAVRGGMAAIGVTTHHPPERLVGAARVCAGLWELDEPSCAALLGAC